MSMDVTFRESIPFYGEKTYLSDLFLDLESPDICDICDTCEVGNKEDKTLETKDVEESRRKKVITVLIPCPAAVNKPTSAEMSRTSHVERNLQVYTRRRKNPSIQPSVVDDICGSQEETL